MSIRNGDFFFQTWLRGWNNSHNSPQCKKMMSSSKYTAQMKAAASPDGNGGNPNVATPVILPFSRCIPCLTHASLPRPQAPGSLPNKGSLPYDDNLSAGLATLVAPTFGGLYSLSRSRVESNDFSPPLLSHASLHPLLKPTLHASWSLPVATLVVPPVPPCPSLSSTHTPPQQALIRHPILHQDKTKPTLSHQSHHNPNPQPPTHNPIPTLTNLSRSVFSSQPFCHLGS
jgi:hypothetical protein